MQVIILLHKVNVEAFLLNKIARIFDETHYKAQKML